MCRSGLHTTLCGSLLLLVEAGLSPARFFFSTRQLNFRRNPRGCPYPPRALPQGLELRYGLVDLSRRARLKSTSYMTYTKLLHTWDRYHDLDRIDHIEHIDHIDHVDHL